MEAGRSGQQAQGRKSPFRRVIEARTREVELSELARKKRRGKIIAWADLEAIMAETIENMLLRGTIDPLLDPAALHAQTTEEFRRVMATHQDHVAAADQARADSQHLELQLDALKAELERQTGRLQGEERLRAARLQLSDEALRAIRGQTLKALRTALDDALAGGGDEALLERLRRDLPGVLDEIVGQQRAEVAAEVQLEQDAELDRMRRRIGKLTDALDSTEQTLQTVMAAKDVDPGIASVYGAHEGLDPGAANGERKAEFLQVVFVNNLLLRGREVRPEDMQGVNDEFLIDQASLAAAAESTTDSSTGRASDDALSFVEPEDQLTDETAF